MHTRHVLALTLGLALAAPATAAVPHKRAAVRLPPSAPRALAEDPTPPQLIPGGVARWMHASAPAATVHVDPSDPIHPCVQIEWIARDPWATHVVERADKLVGPYGEIDMLPRGGTTSTDRALDLTRKYYYRVIAMRAGLRSEPSPIIEIDMPAILAALEAPSEAAAKRVPPPPSPADSSDGDGTALFLAFLLIRSAVRKRRA